MRNFEYFTPTRVIFGKDTHLKIGTVLKEQNSADWGVGREDDPL